MKGTSNLIMWLTIVLLVSIAMVLGLVLLLLAELYCPPLIRSRHRRRQVTTSSAATVDTTTTTITGNNYSRHSPSPPLDSLTSPCPLADLEKQLFDSPENQEFCGTQRQDKVETEKECVSASVNGSSLVYISNPIYGDENGTPFETPDSSPSRLETEDSSGDDEREEISWKAAVTPPLTPMKKLPAEACSVSLKDVRSLGTSGSDTNSINGVSSSCSLTPCTSPSL